MGGVERLVAGWDESLSDKVSSVEFNWMTDYVQRPVQPACRCDDSQAICNKIRRLSRRSAADVISVVRSQ